MTPSQPAQEKPTSPRTEAGRELLSALPLDEWHPINREIVTDHILAIEREAADSAVSEAAVEAIRQHREAAGKDSPATPSLDVAAFLDSLRTPRNSLGKLALPKGPMEWAVEEAWVPPAVEELDDSGDGVMIHRLSELADLIIDRLQARLARLDEGSKDSGRPNEVVASATPDQGKGEPR